MDLEDDEDEITDDVFNLREQIFHNTVREHIVSTFCGAVVLLNIVEPTQQWNLC